MNTTDPKWGHYSLKPITTTLVNSPAIPIRTFTSGEGFTGTVEQSFKDIDIELWCRGFLAATDHFINVLFSPSANEIVHPDVKKVLDIKTALSQHIPGGMVSLFTDAADENQLAIAKEALQKELSKTLAGGYDVATVLVSSDSVQVLLYRRGEQPFDQNGLPADIPANTIPAPLRIYPAPPVLVEQSVAATYPEAETAEQATKCRYTLVYTNAGTTGDIEWIKLAYTLQSTIEPLTTANELFTQLAQFITVYPVLLADLPSQYVPSRKYDTVLLKAVAGFAELAASVSAAWAQYWSDPITAPAIPGIEGTVYGLAKQYNDETGDLNSVTLAITANTEGLPALPVLLVKDSNGKYQQMQAIKVNDSTYSYEYTAANKSKAKEILVEFPGDDIYAVQPFFEVGISRNQFADVNPAFVYRTAAVSFNLPMAPFIEQFDPIIIDPNGAPLTSAINSFFNVILGNTQAIPDVSIDLAYSSPLTDETASIHTTVPVLAIPATKWSEQMAPGMEQAIADWLTTVTPSAGSYFVMHITAFAASNKPVLVLHDVRLAVQQL